MQFEKLTFDNLKTLVGWAQQEGWNPGPYDARVFWETDPDGFWGYREDGKLIAGGALVSYDGLFGFMGLFIVHPDHRSKGIGRELWYQRRDMLLARLNEDASIGMDGVLDMQPFYAKGGFEIAYRDERHGRTGEAMSLDPAISPVDATDFESISHYDEKCFGFPRPQFLRPWLKVPGTRALKFVLEDEMKGFAVLRKAHVGYKICPLFADNLMVAEELYKACLNSVPGEPVYLDIPMANPDAVALVNKFDTEYVFECARMYHGPAPRVALEKVFGITTFELG